MVDFIVGLLTIIAFLGLVYLGFKVIVLFFRTAIMILKMDTTPKKVVEEKPPYTPVGDLMYKENLELRQELASAQREIESLTKGRVLYEKLVIAELQVKKLGDAFEVWRATDGPNEKADIEFCNTVTTIMNTYDTAMLRRYVADEMRVVADSAPISGNHLAQARILMAAEAFERGEHVE